MKHYYTRLVKFCCSALLMLCMLSSRAQYITIPDTGFAGWLRANGWDTCMTGNMLDTSTSRNAEKLVWGGTLSMTGRNISDLTGIHYISWTDQNHSALNIGIDLSNNNFTRVPTQQLYERFSGYFSLIINNNHIDTLNIDNTFFGLETLDANNNGMHSFTVSSNNALSSLRYLDLSYNNLTSFPYLPTQSGYFANVNVRHNQLTTLPQGNMGTLNCGANQISTFQLGADVYIDALMIDSNLLTTMDLAGLATYWGTLFTLDCSHNQLTSLTNLQVPTVFTFLCNDNNLTGIPKLPTMLQQLDCHNNPLLQCIPSLPNVQTFTINFSNTSVQCLPRLYPTCTYISTPAVTSVPTCDTSGNTYGCPQYANQAGIVYNNDTSLHLNCTPGGNERLLQNIPVQFLNSSGTLLQGTGTDYQGHYSFDEITHGSYIIQIDTTYLPVAPHCPDTAYYTTTVDSQELYLNGFNFGMDCRHGFDLGFGGAAWGGFYPNTISNVNIPAGDMSQLWGYHCANGVSGQVQITFNGPITFAGMGSGGLTPTSVNGNVITWNIADFGAINLNMSSTFSMNFHTNSTAQIGDNVCFSANVTPVVGDIVPSNNTFSICDQVHTSYDPNELLVTLAGKIDTFQNWLVYTIHFQNTGNAPATNILITDTLSPYLDLKTFQLLTYSANVIPTLNSARIINFNFNNINLADSATTDTGSRGYVQFKIALAHGLTPGTVISNSASIYFDYNAPVVTNTVNDTIIDAPVCAVNRDTLIRTICTGDTFYVGTRAYTQGGTYTDTLTNAGGCDSIINLTLSIDNILISAININNDTFCSRQSVVALSCQPAGGTFSGPGVTGSRFNPATANTGADTIIYSITDSNQCQAISIANVQVAYLPAGFLVDTTFEDSSGITTFFTSPAVNGTITWQSMSLQSGQIQNIYTSDTLKTYCILYPVSPDRGDSLIQEDPSHQFRAIINFYGCVDTTAWSGTPNCATGGGGGINQVTDDNAIAIYPNPATDVLIIKTENIQAQSITVYDVDGRIIYHLPFKTEVDVHALSSGVYFVEVSSTQGVARKRFVKM